MFFDAVMSFGTFPKDRADASQRFTYSDIHYSEFVVTRNKKPKC